jgi:hypothetical protein
MLHRFGNLRSADPTRWLSDPHPERFLEGAMAQPVFKVR